MDQRLALGACSPQTAPPGPPPHPSRTPPPQGGLRRTVSWGVVGVQNRGVASPKMSALLFALSEVDYYSFPSKFLCLAGGCVCVCARAGVGVRPCANRIMMLSVGGRLVARNNIGWWSSQGNTLRQLLCLLRLLMNLRARMCMRMREQQPDRARFWTPLTLQGLASSDAPHGAYPCPFWPQWYASAPCHASSVDGQYECQQHDFLF